MLKRIKRAYKAAPIATVIFALSLILALGFSTRLVIDVLGGPPQRATEIEAWMTPRFISRNWKVPPEVMREILEVEKSEGRPENLQQLADQRDVDVHELIDDLTHGIQTFKEDRKKDRDRK